ncbi:hypothetical protein [Sagittula salina]|uniref:Uncharacterized protein n=1 Tax=Sagittula salina TaxID=2820268 RepID=A0A940S1N7_9RHOB|nr:hypothetical protein [Sagittula salina]MBP0484353.1 hypothetical protein [Sagittula salina]
MIAGLLIPAAALGALAILVTRGVERVMPETLAGLVLTALVGALLMWLLSAGFFALWYALKAPGAAWLIGQTGAHHFMLLGAQAALIWGPVLVLTVSTAPRRWRTNTW